MSPATFYYEQNEIFEELASGDDSIFDSRIPLILFAASVGFKRDHWVENHDTNGEMRWNYIGQNQRFSVIAAALAYARTEDSDALFDPEIQIDVLTSFAAGGARIIEREVLDEPGDNLDNLVDFLQDHREAEDTDNRVGVLEQIEKEVSSLRSSEN
jgi:dnd system-associated protein 4